MALVKDDTFVNAQNVDSYWSNNRFKTCAKLSKNIKTSSPQFNTHLGCRPSNTQQTLIKQFFQLGRLSNNKGETK